MAKVTDTVAQLALPFVESAGCSLWDVELSLIHISEPTRH